MSSRGNHGDRQSSAAPATRQAQSASQMRGDAAAVETRGALPPPPSPQKAKLMLILAGVGWLCGIIFLAAMVVMRFRTDPL